MLHLRLAKLLHLALNFMTFTIGTFGGDTHRPYLLE